MKAEAICEIAKPFKFTCRLRNTSERKLDLKFKFNKLMDVSAYSGSSEQDFGILQAGEFRDFNLTIFPSRLGIICVNNLRFFDALKKRNYEISNVLQLFVVNDIKEYLNSSDELFKYQDHSFKIPSFVVE